MAEMHRPVGGRHPAAGRGGGGRGQIPSWGEGLYRCGWRGRGEGGAEPRPRSRPPLGLVHQELLQPAQDVLLLLLPGVVRAVSAAGADPLLEPLHGVCPVLGARAAAVEQVADELRGGALRQDQHQLEDPQALALVGGRRHRELREVAAEDRALLDVPKQHLQPRLEQGVTDRDQAGDVVDAAHEVVCGANVHPVEGDGNDEVAVLGLLPHDGLQRRQHLGAMQESLDYGADELVA
mmetsp:Transcript_3635/g.8699  ORF Transcript_3635/g.8699 Transcript_3635/m.8699 type:complete len:236 (+) Transcript_3635:257-964(+)